MAKKKPTVVIGLLGPVLDSGAREQRWERWRPSVAVCQHPDLLVSRFELLHQPQYATLARLIRQDIAAVSPETKVNLVPFAMADPWDLEEVYASAPRLRALLPLRPRARGLPRAHHHGHPRRPDRALPAHRVAAPPGHASPDLAPHARRPRPCLPRRRDLARHRPRPLPLRPPRVALRRRGQGARRRAQGRIETRNAAFNALIDRIERVAVASRAPTRPPPALPARASRSSRGASSR